LTDAEAFSNCLEGVRDCRAAPSPCEELLVVAEAVSTPFVSSRPGGVGRGSGGSERGSMRTRATSKGAGGVPVSVALRSRPVVETVTLRASTTRPMRTTGSLVMRAGSVTTSAACVAGASSGVGVGHSALVARRGRVTVWRESCARGMREGETRRHASRVAAKVLWTEERICLSRLTGGATNFAGGETRRGKFTTFHAPLCGKSSWIPPSCFSVVSRRVRAPRRRACGSVGGRS
jgi:hypothetical protein